MTPTKTELIAMAYKQAGVLSLDPSLVAAVCEQESSWNPNAIRFENKFYEHYTEPMNLPESEELQRACSYGLMQIMGQVARELGFVENFLVLYDPEVNLYLGCKKLKKCLDSQGRIVRLGLLAYNGGGAHSYPDQVLARQPHYWDLPATNIATTSLQEGL